MRPRCYSRSSCRRWRWRTRRPLPLAPGNVDRVNAPALIGAASVASHPPTKYATVRCLNIWQTHHGCDETLRVAAPSLTTSNGATAISADRAVIASHAKAPASCKNVLKRVSAVSAHLQHTAIKSQAGIRVRRFKVEVMPESQNWVNPLEKAERKRVKQLVTHDWRVIDKCGIGRCIGRWDRHPGIRCDPQGRRSLRIRRYPAWKCRWSDVIEVLRYCHSPPTGKTRWRRRVIHNTVIHSIPSILGRSRSNCSLANGIRRADYA